MGEGQVEAAAEGVEVVEGPEGPAEAVVVVEAVAVGVVVTVVSVELGDLEFRHPLHWALQRIRRPACGGPLLQGVGCEHLLVRSKASTYPLKRFRSPCAARLGQGQFCRGRR